MNCYVLIQSRISYRFKLKSDAGASKLRSAGHLRPMKWYFVVHDSNQRKGIILNLDDPFGPSSHHHPSKWWLKLHPWPCELQVTHMSFQPQTVSSAWWTISWIIYLYIMRKIHFWPYILNWPSQSWAWSFIYLQTNKSTFFIKHIEKSSIHQSATTPGHLWRLCQRFGDNQEERQNL